MKELELLLANKQLKNIANLINVNDKKANEYPFGPLNKSTETKIFEVLVHELIEESSKANKEIKFFRKLNNKVMLSKNDIQISLAELMKNTNLTQISLSKDDIMKYAQINHLHPDAPTHDKLLVRSVLNLSVRKLEYGEMLTIRDYTGKKYKDINKFLRNPNSLGVKKIPEMIMHIAVASHGLNKVPNIELPTVIRNEDNKRLNKYIKNVKENKVTQEKAFISTCDDPPWSHPYSSNRIKIIFKNVKGKDISSLSKFPKENEYLLPPSTQLKW